MGMNGKVVFEKASGIADEDWNAHNTTTTKFRISSLSKQFTAACVLLLQERGRLRVRDPISRYLAGLPKTWQSTTIHQLLTHTSGIPNYTDSSQLPTINSNIFERLYMKNSGYDRLTDILKERASGYRIKNGGLANADFIDMTIPYAAGGIYSTVEDMYRWNEAMAQDGKLLSADSLKQMFTEYPEATYQGQHYGYGVVISRQKFGKLLYYHGGGVEGFSSSIQRYPSERVCIVVLSNLGSLKPWELGDYIAADIFHQALPGAP